MDVGNTPRTDPLLAGEPTEAEIAIVDEALTAYECAHRYSAALESPGPERTAGMARARTAARMLERLANNGAGRPEVLCPGSGQVGLDPGEIGSVCPACENWFVRDAHDRVPAHNARP